jgi:hypothetical protein
VLVTMPVTVPVLVPVIMPVLVSAHHPTARPDSV